ncbi:Hypothetical protein, putative [Bodo saltans]|uniref:Uncharacterized protein n=1 Tax=Bodo saltans TaxID=75058 RepID=A0A0S4KP44_BODSA|nr:Hypothetical protein, putative [Bodo saltans]|eukprot:CUI14673.1 Hypothetical protein, putative [Bodo saltans]
MLSRCRKSGDATVVLPRHRQRPKSETSCCFPRSAQSLVVVVLFVVFAHFCCVEQQQPTTFFVSGAQIGCWPCCPYDCNCYNCGWNGDWYDTCCYTCYSCECFTATATGSDYWSGCSNKVLYVNPSASGEIVNNYQVSLQYNGNNAVGRVDSGASVGNVYVYGTGTTTYASGNIGTFNGNGYTGTSVYVYNPATIGTLNGVGSGTISVAAGAGIGSATMSNANVYVNGYITNIYPSASNVYISNGGSSNFIQGYGSVWVTTGGYVNVVQVTASSTVTINGGTVSTLSLTGGSSVISVVNGGTVTNVVVGTSGNAITFSSGSFSSMTFTVPQNSGSTITMSGSTLGCILFQSTVANVPMIFTGSSFSRACHFIQFQNTVTSSNVIANSCAHNIPGYSAIFGSSTFNNFLLRWDTSQLTTTGSSNAFYLQAVGSSGTTISFTNCAGTQQMRTGGNAVLIPSGGSLISLLVVSSTISSSGDTFQCGSASTVTVSSLSSSFLAGSMNVYFTGSVTSLWTFAQNSVFTATAASNVYVAGNMASSSVTCFTSTFTAPSGYGVYVGAAMTSSSVTVTSSSAWTSGVNGITAGSANTVALIITQASYWTTSSSGFLVSGVGSNIGITVQTASTWTNGALGLTIVGAGSNVNVRVQANAGFYSVNQNVYITGGSTSVSITATSTGSTDVARITSRSNANFLCIGGPAINIGVYVTGAGALISSPTRNLYVIGSSASNVDMTVTSSATVTAGSNNWEFDAPLVGTSNEISISSQSFVQAETNNFLMLSTGSLWLTVTGSSILTAVSNNNLYVTGDCGMLRVAFTSSTITAAVNNIFVGGSILSDLTPNYVYMTTATMSAGSTGMMFSTTLGGQNIFTITASAATTWSVGGVGAIYLQGYAVSSTITLISSTISVSTSYVSPAVVQLRSGTAQTMTSQQITIASVPYTYTQTAGRSRWCMHSKDASHLCLYDSSR